MPKSQLEQLADEFPAGAHKSRKQGGRDLTYLSIDATINRVNDVLGTGWSIEPPSRTTVTGETRESKDENDNITRKIVYVAFSELFIRATIDGTEKTLYGVGADSKGDPDDAVKTALAEALKKAFHQAGVGLYLWDEETRERVAAKMGLAKKTPIQLKQMVWKLAKDRLGTDKPTAPQIAKEFGVSASELNDADVLRSILEAQA